MVSENSIKNDVEEREEMKCEDKEDDVFDVSEEVFILNGNVFLLVLINDKDLISDIEKKVEIIDVSVFLIFIFLNCVIKERFLF